MYNQYEKPVVEVMPDLAESVYMASGTTGGSGSASANGCNSKYMGGVYHKPDYSINNNINGLGCNGCPAFRADSCALQTEYLWDSYKVDEGNRMPEWERQGKGPDDARW